MLTDRTVTKSGQRGYFLTRLSDIVTSSGASSLPPMFRETSANRGSQQERTVGSACASPRLSVRSQARERV